MENTLILIPGFSFSKTLQISLYDPSYSASDMTSRVTGSPAGGAVVGTTAVAPSGGGGASVATPHAARVLPAAAMALMRRKSRRLISLVRIHYSSWLDSQSMGCMQTNVSVGSCAICSLR